MSQEKEHYKNREIDEKIESIHEKLDLILAQVTKTNGRVTKCEENINEIKTWKGFITGGVAVLSALMLPVIFMIVGNYIK